MKGGVFMSKRKRKQKEERKLGQNRHHLIFYRANYTGGCAKMLRDCFVFNIDEELHRELHKRIDGIHRPSNADIHKMWVAYVSDREYVSGLGIVDACEWLMTACDDIDWQNDMYDQWQYLKAHIGN